MKYYEPYQRLDFGYKLTKTSFYVYLRASIGVFVDKGKTLVGYQRGTSPKWEIHLFPSVSDSATADYLWESTELFFLTQINQVPAASTSTNNATVKDAIDSLLLKPRLYTVTTIVYNEKNVPVGQVTNTIASDGQIVII